jgi:hypothetical protein
MENFILGAGNFRNQVTVKNIPYFQKMYKTSNNFIGFSNKTKFQQYIHGFMIKPVKKIKTIVHLRRILFKHVYASKTLRFERSKINKYFELNFRYQHRLTKYL